MYCIIDPDHDVDAVGDAIDDAMDGVVGVFADDACVGAAVNAPEDNKRSYDSNTALQCAAYRDMMQ